MTTEKDTEQSKGVEEKFAGMGCCPPENFAEMMTKCCEGTDCDCPTMMQQMMKSGCCQPESK